MSKGKAIKKVRADHELNSIISETVDLFGLPNDSAAMRLLIREGYSRVRQFFNDAVNVAHPLKSSEIDYFTTALNIYLKKHKKEAKSQE